MKVADMTPEQRQGRIVELEALGFEFPNKQGRAVKSVKEIKEALDECIGAVEAYELSNEGEDSYINQGWIEALEYVLNI